MKNYLSCAFVLLVAIQLCHSTTVELARFKLQQLQDSANKGLNEALREHFKMSREIDETSLNTKNKGAADIKKKTDIFLAKQGSDKARKHLCRGSHDHYVQELQETFGDDLNNCVDRNGKDSVNVVSSHRESLSDYIWKTIKEEEKNIIKCGTNHRCLKLVAAAINDKADELESVIQDEIDITQHYKETYLQSIKTCLTSNVANVESKLHSFPVCVY